MIREESEKTSADIIRETAYNLPYFAMEDLFPIDISGAYLKILLYRFARNKEIIRLKRGVYVAKEYIDKIEKEGNLNSYLEFLAVKMYEPTYLSAEYVLSEHGILTENIQAFTGVSRNKTKKFINNFGVFNYKHMKDDLFTGFNVVKKGRFLISKASLAKALFDFLYLRKNIISNEESFLEFRLNAGNITNKDIKELKRYVDIEGSLKMKKIFNFIRPVA